MLNVLIVEKESIIALDLKHKLKSMDCIVIITQSGEEALKIIENNKIDLIFTATHLQGALNGIETAIQIRNKLNIPIIYISANSNLATFDKLKQTRPYKHLIKPFDDSQMQTAINNCLMAIKLNEIQEKCLNKS